MSTVVELLTWADYESDLKTELGVTDTSEDARLRRLLESSAYAADDYFKLDTFEDPLPSPVVEGCYAWVRTMRDARAVKFGVTSIKVGDDSVGYANSAVTKVEPGTAAESAAIASWRTYRGTFRGVVSWPSSSNGSD